MYPRGLLRRPLLAAVVSVVTLGPIGLATAYAQPPPDARSGAAAAPAAAQTRTFTLVTGDRVTLTGGPAGQISVRAAPGRDGVAFLTQRLRGHTQVLPTDVLPLVGAGRLDRRLFDLTELANSGYDDAARADLPLIVQYARAGSARAREKAESLARDRVTTRGGKVARDLPAARGLAVRAAKRQAAGFWSAVTTRAGGRPALATGIDRIWLDARRRVTLDESVPMIGAPTAWGEGYTGTGVRVAVIDTGVDATHPDLAGKIAAAANFTDAPDADDMVGHGTHVASTIAGAGAVAPGQYAEYTGVAPDATLISGKVCADIGCEESAMLAGFQWAAVDQDADVINVSIGGMDGPGLDPLEEAVNTLTAEQGALFVISAGNDGPGGETVNSPSSAEAALSVAAVDKSDLVADFSSRGPRVGDGGLKPEIAAPGVDIVAARARNGYIGDPVEDVYLRLSGTSMAAPHVAGTAALLLQRHPGWTPEMVKAALMNTATERSDGLFTTGTGRLDAAAAVDAQVVAFPGSLNLGVQRWPHGDDQPVARTVGYHNATGAPVTVSLALEATAPYGEPLPAGIVTLSADELTVPAGGTGEVTLTIDTRGDRPYGQYLGRLRATVGGAAVAATPFVFEVEAERYSVTVRHTDAAGVPSSYYYDGLIRLDAYDEYWPWADGPETTVRVPPGSYQLQSVIMTDPETPEQRQTLFAYPALTVDRDITVDFDARQAVPARFVVPDATATPMAVNVAVDRMAGWGPFNWSISGRTPEAVTALQVGPNAPADEFFGRVEAILGEPDLTAAAKPRPSPYRYNLAWYTPGTLPNGFVGVVKGADLATVTETYLPIMPGWVADKSADAYPTAAGWLQPGWFYIDAPIPLPATMTQYYMAEGVRWRHGLYQYDPATWDGASQWTSEPVGYRRGSEQRVTWGVAVVGPSTAAGSAWRSAYSLYAWIPMFSDGTPGHIGDSPVDSSRTALYRDGRLLVETPGAGNVYADVQPYAATYRLTVDATRGFTDLSTRISAAWTFVSGSTTFEEEPLPLLAVRFSPAVDLTNTAPAGGAFTIPVTVEGAVGEVATFTVEASYDDGVTWQPATVKRAKTGWQASLTHPAGAGHVALRTRVTDVSGNAYQATIIRAYHIG